MPAINFFFEGNTHVTALKKNLLRSWIQENVAQYQYKISCINYIFCDDAYLHGINLQYLQHDTFTDIITFDNSTTTENLEGDIFISIERVKENALIFGFDFTIELNRVLAHGTLHLLGFKDKKSKDKEEMRKHEDLWIAKLSVPRGTYK